MPEEFIENLLAEMDIPEEQKVMFAYLADIAELLRKIEEKLPEKTEEEVIKEPNKVNLIGQFKIQPRGGRGPLPRQGPPPGSE